MINKSILIVIVLPRYIFVSFLTYILIPNTNKKSKIKLINVDIKIYLIVSNLFIKISINTSIKITINTIILKFVEHYRIIMSKIFTIQMGGTDPEVIINKLNQIVSLEPELLDSYGCRGDQRSKKIH